MGFFAEIGLHYISSRSDFGFEFAKIFVIEKLRPTKKGPLSFVLLESPFTSDSTVSGGHPSVFSLVRASGLVAFETNDI